MYKCGGNMYYGRWSEGLSPKDMSDGELAEQLRFLRFIKRCRPEDNEVMDKIHDLSDEEKRRFLKKI